MSDAAKKRATYDDVLAAPPHRVAELVDGTLYTHPRPATPHAIVASRLGFQLGPAFDDGGRGPGGWVVLHEPELHLGPDILVPDLGAWRREHMPVVPDAPYLERCPDWVCEVLSPSTAAFDRAKKIPIYAGFGARYAWLLDPKHQTLEVLELNALEEVPRWTILQTFEGPHPVRAQPFDAIELKLGRLWAR